MTALCATLALVRAARLETPLPRATDLDAARTLLGPWHLDVLHLRGSPQLIVAMDARTRWAFAYLAAPWVSCGERFAHALLEALIQQGVPPDRARQEVGAGQHHVWARDTDRSLQAHMRQCKDELAWAASDGEPLGELNQRLADRLILKPKAAYPVREVLSLLGGDPELPARRQMEKGQSWRRAYEYIKAQADAAVLRVPVRLLLDAEHLSAGYHARILFSHVPGSRLSTASGHCGRMPDEVVLDFNGIESVGLGFVREIHALAAMHGSVRFVLDGCVSGVCAALLESEPDLRPRKR